MIEQESSSYESMSEQESKEEKKEFSIWDLPDVPMGVLPPHLQLQKTRVVCKADAPIHVSLTYPSLLSFVGFVGTSLFGGFYVH